MNFRGPADYPRSACRAWIVFAWCLLLGAGIETAREWFGCIGRPGNELRRILLAAGFSIYYVRILFTVFVFLKRGMSWSEAFTIAGWLLCIVMLLGIAGGTNSSAVDQIGFFGATLFVVGSWMNSYANTRASSGNGSLSIADSCTRKDCSDTQGIQTTWVI